MSLAQRAYRIRRNALRMGAVQGQGYIAQTLGIGDVLAMAYFHALRYRPGEPASEERGRLAALLLRSRVALTFRQVALPDAFLDAGALPTLHDRYGISTRAMAGRIKGWL